jgi:undecaprenyl-phosphate 4-deoxy-4-formamido-L-arabinose transferase
MTGFSLVPLKLFTLLGFLLLGGSFLLVLYIFVRRLFIGPGEWLFALFSILFFMISVTIVGIGLIGEYVGRMYQIVLGRPRYILRKVYDTQMSCCQ